MEGPTPRPEPMYPGELTDENIKAIFNGAGDFIARELKCGQFSLYTYAIDGLTSGSATMKNKHALFKNLSMHSQNMVTKD